MFTFPPYRGVSSWLNFTEFTPVVPEIYWNVYSSEERIKALCKELVKLITYTDSLGLKINELGSWYEELSTLFQQFMESGFEDYYKEQIIKYLNEKIDEFLACFVHKQVYFGLTRDGYFVANKPDAWSDIIFDTGMDYSNKNTYGRLILRYDVDKAINCVDFPNT